MVKCLPTMRETQVQSLGQEDPLETEMATTPVLLPGIAHGQRSIVGYSPWGRKELDTTEPLDFQNIYMSHGLAQHKALNLKLNRNLIDVDITNRKLYKSVFSSVNYFKVNTPL